MNQLMNMSHNQTMTSKELVEVINAIRKEEGNDVEIQHSHLMQRIRSFANILPEAAVAVGEYLDSNNQKRPMLLLNKEACLLTVSSESPRVNLAIIRRWQELEMRARPLTYLEALKELVAKEELNQQLQVENLHKTVALGHKNDITNEGEDYFTIATIKKLNQGMKLSGSKLTRESYDQELIPKQLFSMYGVNAPYSYHRDVWEAVYPDIVLPNS